MMNNNDLEHWDEERYKELNTYFRIKIEQMLRLDGNLREMLEQGEDLQLQDIVAHMSEDDKDRWKEFIKLDQQKMQIDMWNHLNGKGTPYKPGTGFSRPEDTTW